MKRQKLKIHTLVSRAYEEQGYAIDTCERRIPSTFISKDLFGVFDCIAIGHRIIGVQLTSMGNLAARRDKVMESEHTIPWLTAGGVIHLAGLKHNARTDLCWIKIEVMGLVDGVPEITHEQEWYKELFSLGTARGAAG